MASFCQGLPGHDLEGLYQCFGDQLYLLPSGLPDLKKVKIARNGLHLGTFKKNRFEPSFALGLALKPDQVKKSVSLSDPDFMKYVAGETIQLDQDYPNGWYQVLAGGNGLGFAKVTGRTLKNFFPKGLRLDKLLGNAVFLCYSGNRVILARILEDDQVFRDKI